MIRIQRPVAIPAALQGNGTVQTRSHCDDYDQGLREFDFKQTIYGDREVKETLHEIHSGKCCFCEKKCRPACPGDIEHFRPKNGVCQNKGDELEKPGYYWLAYEWTNLFFSCEFCNRSYKKNYFPLQNPANRARSHHDDISREEPFLINPGEENPESSISFREHAAIAVNSNIRGQMTIDLLELNRTDLFADRLSHLQKIRNAKKLLECLNKLKEFADLSSEDLGELSRVRTELDEAIKDSAEYASMNRCFLKAATA